MAEPYKIKCNDPRCLLPGHHHKDSTSIPTEVPIQAPPHYTVGGIDNIDYLRAKMSTEMLEGFYMGNVIKYLARYKHKDGINDLKKAHVYLGWLVELCQKSN